MPDWVWAIVVVAAVLVAAAAAWQIASKRRSDRLRGRFGTEYDRAIERTGGSRREAETELAERERRREQLHIRPLSRASHERYSRSWREVQASFVDDPQTAVDNADALVISVMAERGYPMDDFEQRAADVSVDHPDVVENYREAHRIAQASKRGTATTEDLRRAMKHYRALFEDLLETQDERPTRDGSIEERTAH